MKRPQVCIVMGSTSDLPVMKAAAEVLDSFEVPFRITISSAHRSPDRTKKLAQDGEREGIKVFIVGAGYAAVLAGVIAAETVVPVLGVPIESSPLRGFDALLATVQMPAGVPVGTMSVGISGAKNAALMAVEIVGLSDPELQDRYRAYKRELAEGVEARAREVERQFEK
ncbi:5-(carboxyamino)imidazole ribonucleotide mutase [bacterium]|nr:5-(carboxyamino)imidazole ribonucleotide mutase [candidate division CSSED10-310 bacterium]